MVIWEWKLSNYKIEINEIHYNEFENVKNIGIWAKIKNLKTGELINKHIWWKDSDGIIHDGTKELPVKLRDLVDNAWLEYRHSL
jgi:hypothetical protein